MQKKEENLSNINYLLLKLNIKTQNKINLTSNGIHDFFSIKLNV